MGGFCPLFIFLNKGTISLKRIEQYIIPALLASFICGAGICLAIDITATGTWSDLTIDALNLTAGAGSDLNPTYASASNAVSIDITGTIGNWALKVQRDTFNWHSGLHLYIQRTSNGGNSTISGGDFYQEVTDIDQPFFSGNGDVNNVTVQFELRGVSIQVPPNMPIGYTTMVTYTVSDT